MNTDNTKMALDTLSNFIAASRSVGTAGTLAGAGIYLHRKGLVTNQGKKLLALISQQVTIPALLFSKIVYCKQDSSDEECTSVLDMMNGAWAVLFWPLYVVSCGLIVGYLVSVITKAPTWQRPVILATCAFGNSTGLPITLLSVIHANFPPTEELGRVDPAIFLSIYLLLYPILQWGVGGWLLTPQDEPHVAEKWLSERDTLKPSTSQASTTILTVDDQSASGSNCGLVIEPSSSSPPDQLVVPSDEMLHHEDEDDIEQNDQNQEETIRLTDNDINAISYGTERSSLRHSACSVESRNSLLRGIQTVASKSLQPPVIGSLLGLFITSIKPIRALFVDMVDRNDNAPLEWFFDGIYAIGQAAVPINMIILGVNLSKSMSSTPAEGELLSTNTTLGIIIGKLVIMPLIGICSISGLSEYILDVPEGIDAAFYLVMMIVFITPTANNVMVMVELSDGAKEGVARLIGLQYAVAPVLLSISVATVVSLANNFG